MPNNIEEQSVNTIRTLSIDAIENANSGHPGLPMGAAPMAYTLWTDFMTHNPNNSKWFNRDRFVLSAGHGSMLLYSLLHLSGYNVTIEDLKEFRQWDSKTPGHPEVNHTDGVEATTGPLGQGIAMSVGMAMAEAHLAAKFNKDDIAVVNHNTYALVSDGDLMEGISHEAASLAGHLGLGKLIALYDSNDISLDGELNRSFSDNTEQRFEAYGWQVIRVEDGNDLNELRAAIKKAKENTDQPTLIEVKTVIGYGSPNKSASAASHGAPLGKDEVKLTKEFYKWGHEDFHVPEEVYADFKGKISDNGAAAEEKWNQQVAVYKEKYPELANEFELALNGKLPADWEKDLPVFEPEKDTLATRASSGKVLNAIAKAVPNFFGGSADLAGSNKTTINDEDDFTRNNYAGRNVWFGVREHAMGAALNGMALHGGLNVYAGTFFVFSDYLRPAVRLSSIMNVPVTYVFTHDSIAVGEDGPTHEPVEHLAALRAMPGLSLIRPADGNETQAAWRLALESTDTPTALVLTRQNLPTLEGTKEHAYEGVKKGAYIVSKAEKDTPDALLLATGSEVQLAVAAQKELATKGIDVQVVSMPSWDRFNVQEETYKNTILPPQVKKRVAIEMAASFGWERYVGSEGKIIAIDKFGASANGDKVIEEYGFTVENVVNHVKSLL
ncbi:transketolase [Virgibacillus halodenitrificans]|uniref:Transketolase n=1 Tax=Virgibacillus halodenitrificans TaxID=1482 RepID=A0AAC9J2S6_VIRHA|nr:transketolase [Virgibacillus halodenitrificans]APC48539.1 transketolase [Virgibacillus halodenitrificans]MCG1028413.1 transketolase [Virgibacillus halodenitrificans]MCJ0931115.1 transketolase [Virgibacillus halodenitrificans]MEC2160937.1 transketolase [Virgibacillus halodenitrificans]MYL45370.1 transketolase [Virgibacillus halodenitrificans]